jgi:hypothetical protein
MATCKKCGLPIIWAQEGGRWTPSDPDGGEHWGTCKQQSFEAMKVTGVKFSNRQGSGIRFGGKDHCLARTGTTTPRTDFRLVDCGCNATIPPWIDCEHTLHA